MSIILSFSGSMMPTPSIGKSNFHDNPVLLLCDVLNALGMLRMLGRVVSKVLKFRTFRDMLVHVWCILES